MVDILALWKTFCVSLFSFNFFFFKRTIFVFEQHSWNLSFFSISLPLFSLSSLNLFFSLSLTRSLAYTHSFLSVRQVWLRYIFSLPLGEVFFFLVLSPSISLSLPLFPFLSVSSTKNWFNWSDFFSFLFLFSFSSFLPFDIIKLHQFY